jgi:hypothetical protein
MPAETLLVIMYTRSSGQFAFETNETRDELMNKILGDRAKSMIYVTGIDKGGWTVEMWFDPKRAGFNDVCDEISQLTIRKPPVLPLVGQHTRLPGPRGN